MEQAENLHNFQQRRPSKRSCTLELNMDTQNGGLEKVAPEKQLFLVSMVELKGYKLRLSLCYPPPTIQPVQHLWYCNSICQSGPHTGWRDKPVVNNPKTIDLVPKEMCRAPSALWIDPRIIWAVTPNLIVVLVQDLQARNLTRMLKNGALERCSISVYRIIMSNSQQSQDIRKWLN